VSTDQIFPSAGDPSSLAFLDLTRRLVPLDREIHAAISSTLAAGNLILGPAVERFEAAFAQYCGVRHGVGVASGTDAITLALEGLGIGRGDEVITAANTCVPTVAAIRATGATTVLVDAHPHDWTLDPERLPEAVSGRTRAIVPVHLYGRPADMRAVQQFAGEHGLAVVEDAAQAHGASLGAARVGSLGDAAAFSFYPTKNLGGLGDGGMVVTDRDDVAEAVRMRRNYGLRDGRALSAGRCSRLDELHASVLEVALRRLDAQNLRRRRLAHHYLDALAEASASVETQRQSGGVRSAWHLFPVVVEQRDAFRRDMARLGIETRIHYPFAVHQHPGLLQVIRPSGHLHCSERLARSVVSLPLYPELTDTEVDRVAAAAVSVLTHLGQARAV
jgi:dTDP-4-amino-4,6-dideoxygalactose transaminase